MNVSAIAALFFLGAWALCAPLCAQAVVVPNANATSQGAVVGSSAYASSGWTVQTYLHRSQLSAYATGTLINSIAVRLKSIEPTMPSALDFASYTVELSQSDAASFAANQLASTTFAANQGPGLTVVRSGALHIAPNSLVGGMSPNPFSYLIAFTTNYAYVANTDIVVTIRHTGNGSGSSPWLDEASAAAGASSALGSNSATATTGSLAGSPLIMQLTSTTGGLPGPGPGPGTGGSGASNDSGGGGGCSARGMALSVWYFAPLALLIACRRKTQPAAG